jgi:hypothetical protein
MKNANTKVMAFLKLLINTLLKDFPTQGYNKQV